MRIKKCLLLFSLILSTLLQAEVSGANPYSVRYRAADGLPEGAVNCIAQDSEGFIWTGSEKGLSRFDGYNFRHYGLDGAGSIHSIFTADDGTIWAGTAKGIVLFHPENGSSEKFSKETEWNVSICCKTTVITRLGNGNIFIGTEGQGFFIYDSSEGTLRQFSRYASMISSMATYGDSLMYIGSEESTISEFSQDGRFLQELSFDQKESSSRLSKVKSLSITGDRLWTAFQSKGLCSIPLRSADTSLIPTRTDGAPYVRFCMKASDGSIMAGSSDAVFQLDTAAGTLATVISGLESAPRCIFKDRDEGLWIGLEEDGLIYCPMREQDFHHWLGGKNITAVAKGEDGRIWAGTSSGEIFSFNRNGDISNSVSTGAHQMLCLLVNGPEIWIGTRYDGLFIYNMDTRRTENLRYDRYDEHTICDNCVNALFKDSAGKIYVGTEWGFGYYDRGEGFSFEPRGTNHASITGFFEDSFHKVWILTGNDGLFREDLNGKEWQTFNTYLNHNLISDTIHDIIETSPGTLWFATSTGLCSWSYAKKMFSKTDGISDNISSLEMDSDGRIWYSHSDKISCMSSDGRMTYNRESGIQCSSFSSRCSIYTDDGELIFGGRNGLERFSPDDILSGSDRKQNRPTRPVRITDILIDGEHADLSGKPLVIGSDVKNIVLHFSDLEFRTLDTQPYSYMMNKSKTGWQQCGTTVTFGKPSAGRHTLSVIHSGEEDMTATSIQMRVKAPVYARWWAFLIYACLTFITVAYTATFIRRRQKEATFKEKYSFFTNVIHEIRTPLTLIKAPLEKLMRTEGLSEPVMSSLNTINKGADTLTNLVNQLLDYRKNENGSYELHPGSYILNDMVSEICGRFRVIAESEGKHIDVSLPEENWSYSVDEDAFGKMLGNLLSNAVKYAESEISVRLTAEESFFTVSVSNDGEKIASSERENVFKMFYQINGSKKGTGIGLPLARMLAERHGGTLNLDTGRPHTTFVIRIPGTRSLAEQTSTRTDQIQPETVETNASNILIIDDNEDLRKMIAEMLKDSWNILEASNGKEAIDILGSEAIDLVLSDIMMPEMDGYEFCEFLKSDMRYSAIPIILLSAKTAVEDKIKGLKYGADDYIEKPFSPDLLITKVSSMLEKREKLKEFYRGLPVVHPSQISKITKSDSDFIVKMKETLEKHLSEVDYNMVNLAEDMFMSQSSFYRKVKTLTGVSPNDFVKEFKLQRAAEMLSDGKFLANEVYRQVGFNSVSYFSQCFKKKYGMSPLKYVESLK